MHIISSSASIQSGVPSQYHEIGMHNPVALHSNSSATQVVTKDES